MNKFVSLLLAVLLLSCQSDEYKELTKVDPIDPYGELTRDDFTDQLVPPTKAKTKIKKKKPPIPKASEILLKPKKPRIGVDKTVSISVTEDVPLKDVFLELAKLADIDIEIDPAISDDGVIFKATNKPFQDVIERLTSLARLKYEVNDGVLSIKQDLPYVKTYQMNFLNLVRSNSGNIDVTANVLSAGEVDNESVATGSSNNISTSYDGDLWASVEANLIAILDGDESNSVNLNRQASLLTIRASEADHKMVKAYLDTVKDFYSAQVLVEAKVVEVQLRDQYRSGIDWQITDGLVDLDFDIAGATEITNGNFVTATFSQNSDGLDGMVELASIFGTTRTLSSPRVLILNNQQSVLTFARNEIYFNIEIETTTEDDGSGETTESTDVSTSSVTVPIGIILTLQPLIDKINNEVIMTIRPTVSRTTGEVVQDPGLELQAELGGVTLSDSALASAEIPQVEVREMDSVLRLQNGQIMAIGGMIEERSTNLDSGTPWLSDIPILGNAFKTVDKDTEVVQTVIFLKATIVPGYGVDAPDQDFYNTFTNDPRHFDF